MKRSSGIELLKFGIEKVLKKYGKRPRVSNIDLM